MIKQKVGIPCRQRCAAARRDRNPLEGNQDLSASMLQIASLLTNAFQQSARTGPIAASPVLRESCVTQSTAA
jgi:hypothetical protein